MENRICILKDIDNQIVEELENKGHSRLVAKVLANRPELLKEPNNYDPMQMKDMSKAIARIKQSVDNNEKITIYGDFDADGVTATAALYLYLKSLNANVQYYVPDRIGEGYGINSIAIDQIVNNGTNLIITVDTGITAVDDVERAMSLGVDVIVTDHHEPVDRVPAAIAVIDPKQEDCEYPCKELAGVGVVYKLIQAYEGNDKEISKYLPLVALGTIADVVPLLGENRKFVADGLERFASSENNGIIALLQATNPSNKPVTASMIGFVMAPRINAAGRLGSAHKSVEMFVTQELDEARNIAISLAAENKHRQEIEHNIFVEAVDIIEKRNLNNDKVIVLGNEGWHQGVVGIVASKITEKYHRPSILVSIEKDGVSKGSGRSINTFNLFEALSACKDYMVKFGGHFLAAGLTIKVEQIEEFRKAINEYAAKMCEKVDNSIKILVDCKLNHKDISMATLKDLEVLEPYGMGNAMPVFLIQNAKLVLVTTMSDGKHLRTQLAFGQTIIDGIGFGMGDMVNELVNGEMVDVVGSLNINEFNGRMNLQILLKDIKNT